MVKTILISEITLRMVLTTFWLCKLCIKLPFKVLMLSHENVYSMLLSGKILPVIKLSFAICLLIGRVVSL